MYLQDYRIKTNNCDYKENEDGKSQHLFLAAGKPAKIHNGNPYSIKQVKCYC